MYNLSKDELIERCQKFWHREPTDRPLLGVLVNRITPLKHFTPGSRSDGLLEPEDITVEAFLTECERRHQAAQYAGGDTPYVAYPWAGLAWLEGILGLPIRFDGNHAWPEAYNGGYWNGNQPLWTPGRNMFVPADAVSILSPDTVEEFVTLRLRRITEHLDYCIAHTHSTYLHAIDSVLKIDGFQCIQAGQDTDGPPIDEMLPIMRRIQASKSLIVAICQPDVEGALEQARKAWNELDPAGLCILVYLETAEKGREFMEQFNLNS